MPRGIPFHQTRRTSLMVPTLWVCLNFLAKMRDDAGIPVSMDTISELMSQKNDTMHYHDLTEIGEHLLVQWMQARPAEACHQPAKILSCLHVA